MLHDKNCVCTFLFRFIIPLCHPPELLAECGLPHFGCGGVIHQFLVTGDCDTCDWMHPKCSDITGRPFFTCFMRHHGVNLVLAFASSWMVSTFIACLDTILCWTPCGMGMYVLGLVISCILRERLLTLCISSCHSTLFCPTTGQLCMFGSMMSTRWIAGTVSGVLFLVCCQCKRGMFFNTH